MTKKSVIAAAVVATLGMGAFGVTSAFAASDSGEDHGPMQYLVTAIAEKFNLDEAEVREVFEEHRDAIKERHQENVADHLAKAVEDGKLTQAQADAIAENMKTQHEFFESVKDMSNEDRQAALKENAESQKEWAEENDIPKEFAPGHGSKARRMRD